MPDINLNEVDKLLETKTLAESARTLNISYQCLARFCKKNNLSSNIKSKRGRKSKTDQHKNTVVDMYAKGYSQEQISKKIGVSRPWVRAMLKKEGEEIRSLAESAKLRHKGLKAEDRKRMAAAANAVRHAMGVLNIFR